ncbi:MAG: NAD/NADP octopine/nopaline dehydrogenase family protein [Clostridiales bacterium]|nr:NAD/NADP octopine/nopaline dehydrogenase family protein [Clostridiales bacterium]
MARVLWMHGLTPTLHISRLFSMYKDCNISDEYDSSPYFYRDWTDEDSVICYELDLELHRVCAKLTVLGIDMREVVPYPIHYESPTPEMLTKKLRSIRSFRDIKGPLRKNTNGKYVLDIKSRYFTESFPYRLAIVNGLAEIIGIDVPLSTKVLQWYCELANKEYYDDSMRLCGRDVGECNIPQNYGIHSINSLIDFYNF